MVRPVMPHPSVMQSVSFESTEDFSQNNMTELDQLLIDTSRQIAETPSFLGRVKIVTCYSTSLSILASKHILTQPTQFLGSSGNMLRHAVRWMTENPLKCLALSTSFQGAMGQIACTNAAGSWDSACKINSAYFTTANDAAMRQIYNTACESFLPSDWCQNNIYPDVRSLGGAAIGQVANAAVGIDYNVNFRCVVNPAWLDTTSVGRDICFDNLPASALPPTSTTTTSPPDSSPSSVPSSILTLPSSSTASSPLSSSTPSSETSSPASAAPSRLDFSTTTTSAQMSSPEGAGNSSASPAPAGPTSSTVTNPTTEPSSSPGVPIPTIAGAVGTGVCISLLLAAFAYLRIKILKKDDDDQEAGFQLSTKVVLPPPQNSTEATRNIQIEHTTLRLRVA